MGAETFAIQVPDAVIVDELQKIHDGLTDSWQRDLVDFMSVSKATILL
jgi:hypothetical protein